MNVLDLLQYAALVKAFVDAVKATPDGEPVQVPTIKGVRFGKRSYTVDGARLTPEKR